MRSIVSPLDGFASPFGPQRGFNPLRIFANDEPGVWFEANDANTLFTDVAGTTPVTTPGDAVALQLDKSQGLTLGPDISGDAVGASFAGPVATLDGDTWTVVRNADGTISQKVDIEVTGRYEINFTVLADGTETSNLFLLNDNTGDIGFGVNGPGTYTARPSFSNRITWRPNGNASFKLIINSVRELPGNHRTQATVAARPLYALHPVGGVRNLLEYTEEFDNAVWVKTLTTISANSATAPDDESTADKLVETTAPGTHTIRQVRSANAGTHTVQVFLKAGERTRAAVVATKSSGGGTYSVFNLSTGQIDEEGTDFGTGVTFVSNSITDVGDGWYLCIIKAELNSATDFGISVNLDNATSGSLSQTYTGDGTSGLFVWHPQLEVGSTATNYQRVGSFLDVSEEGKARRGRIWYNGTSHFMQTGTITPGTDKVQVFAGVRKLSDAAAGILIESSTISETSTGAFGIAAPGSSTKFIAISRGTLIRTAGTTSAAYNAPTTRVVSAFSDISGDRVALHIDGTQVAQSTADQGTGNFLAYPLYFGARAGTSLFFSGYEDTSIIRFGPNLDADTISKVESYVASKTPEPTI